jgi:hypothetical protein
MSFFATSNDFNDRLIRKFLYGNENGLTNYIDESVIRPVDHAEQDARLAQAGRVISAKGFGSITDLGIAAANDFDLADLLATTAAAMRRAANDDESASCIVGNRRVWWTGESIWGVAA